MGAAMSKCPRCGAEVDSHALDGLCPECLLGEGAVSEDMNRARGMPEEAGLAPDTSPAKPAGTRFGDYELLEVIAHGGMGMIYKARQVSLNRLVAIKMLLFGAHSSPAAIQRFRAEAVTAASLRHPNIVAIHEVGFCEGQHFLAMDYVEGRPLSALIAGRPLPARRAAGYLRTIAEAIHHAHERGILHRDLKPSNVLIDRDDQPRLTDFGLAKRLESDSNLTVSGQVLGSPNYMSPEQAGGKRGSLSRRSDIYSLGAMLYELLTGRPPFLGDGLSEIVSQVLKTEPLVPRALNPSVPVDLQTICLKCLEKEPDKRYSTALALAEDLGRFLEGRPVSARPVGRVGKSWRWCRRQPARAALVGALALALVLGGVGVLWQWRRAVANELRARQSEYAADITLAQHALDANDPGLAISLLDKYQPTNGGSALAAASPDLRGWEWRYLRQLCLSDERFTLARYPTHIDSLQVSTDGHFLALRKGSAQVVVWDLHARRSLAELPSPGPLWARSFAFVPGSGLLAVGSVGSGGEPQIVIWDPNVPREQERFPVRKPVHALSFSPDGKQLAILHQAGDVTILELSSKRVLKQFPAESPQTMASGDLFFSRDGERLVIAEFDGRLLVRQWRTEAKPLLISERPDSGLYITLAISPDANLVAWSHADASTNVWLGTLVDGKPLGRLTGHTEWVVGLAFSPDGQWLAAAGADRTIRVWDVQQRTQVWRLQGHKDEVWCAAFPDGKTLISGGKGGSVRVWDLTTTNNRPAHSVLPERVRGPPYSVPSFVASGESFITVCLDGCVRLWDTHSLRELERLSFLGTGIRAADLSPDNHWLAATDGSGNLRVWDWTSRQVVTNLAIPATDRVRVGFAADGRLLLANTGLPQGWETVTWKSLGHGPDFQRLGITRAPLLPNGRQWVSGHQNGAIKLWTFPANELLAEFPGHSDELNDLACSPDGQVLASVGNDGYVNLYDLRARQIRARFRAHYNAAVGVCFSADGGRLVTFGAARDSAKLWDLATLRPMIVFPWENRQYLWAGFSPDGSTLARVNGGGVVEVWHALSFAELEAAERAKAPPGPGQ